MATKKTAKKSIPITAKIVVVKRENPFREGTDVAKRAAAVLSARTVEQALKKGARRSTVRWLRDHRVIKIAA